VQTTIFSTANAVCTERQLEIYFTPALLKAVKYKLLRVKDLLTPSMYSCAVFAWHNTGAQTQQG
jgi:hypothetical protein